MIKAPTRIAVLESPGTPRLSIGIIAPPEQPLFADSEAAIPSGIPVPNFSGCLLERFASLYETKAAISPPAPGMAPINEPRKPPFITVGKMDFMSDLPGKTPEILVSIFWLFRLASKPARTSEIANKPINAGMNGIPSYKP